MIFDLFHSVSDPVVGGRSLGPVPSVRNFLAQAQLAESLGMDTVWLAESHFSSEVQKQTSVATIQNFFGEVGLNCDSFQLFSLLAAHTQKINLGTGIHNIVGGSGGPIASAERVNFLHFVNQNFWGGHRELRLGVASGRFPYQNTPFGIVPRNEVEKDLWGAIKRSVFLEALEIFLRLLKGESLSSEFTSKLMVQQAEIQKASNAESLLQKYSFPVAIEKRWSFEKLQLVPHIQSFEKLNIVLGSSDPEALTLAYRHWDVDLFNLSFTPPEQIEKLHEKMRLLNTKIPWTRSRLPRTVMVFIDKDRKKAQALAHFVLDAYREAMKGTAQVPDQGVLLQRALVGDAAEIRDQLHPDNPRRFNQEDRLMLWFEFNQLDNDLIQQRMRYFFDEVVGKL